MAEIAHGLPQIILAWCDVDTDLEIKASYEVRNVPFILLCHPVSNEMELIKEPSKTSIRQVLKNYNAYYVALFE